MEREDGSTRRQHLEIAWKATGRIPQELADEPDFPTEVMYIWEWFDELNQARQSNGFSLNPLSYAEIMSWNSLGKINISPWEVKALKLLDRAYIESKAVNK